MSPTSNNSKPANSNKRQRPSPKLLPNAKGTKSNDGVSSLQLPLQLQDNAPDFPRGRGSSLSGDERSEIKATVDNGFNGDQLLLKKRKKEKRVHNNDASTDDLGSLFGDGIMGKLPRFANKITLKNISLGMKLWGVIDEVNEKDIVVSLPGGLRGLVRACDAFDPVLDDDVKGDLDNILSRLYHKGQLVPCIVMQIDGDGKETAKRKIWLSLRLSLLHKSLTLDAIQEGMVLSAYMKSCEDHGFILHFGLPSFAGFMPKHGQCENRKIEVSVGKLLQGVVKTVDRERKVVYMSSDSDTVSRCVTRELKGISIDLLVPGMLVNARVQSTIENGILLSFLTYFTGTVDIFNLDKIFPGPNWKSEYVKNMKLNARVLFIDPTTRAIGLTLNPHLVSYKASASPVKIGEIFEQSKVVRIDKGLGLLLEVPTLPIPTPTYVNISDVVDKDIGKLDKRFKEGSKVRVRILGYRHLDGIATGTLKASAFEGLVFTHSDVKPGMVVKGKVIALDTFGAIVQFSSGMKALCPLRHMSEFEITKPRKKFQVGIELVFRVLGCKSKRITVTHKKTLVKSKLEILSSYTDATDGLFTHGWITKIEKHGCFVRFYNGVQGFAPRSELGLSLGSDIGSFYHVEQVVKCRVVKSIPASRRIILSFNKTPQTRSVEDETVKLGSLVSGVVECVTPQAVILDINASNHLKGTIALEHLSDHHGLATLFMSVIRPGYHFDQLLVLDIEGNNLVLSAKYSLVHSSHQLPADIAQLQSYPVVPGYICNIIETGCFVRFIGRLTGFAPKSKATDDRRLGLSEVFYIGQSVRSSIVDVSSEMGRITLSLRQSQCCSIDTSFIQEYFSLEEKIAKMQVSDLEDPGLRWVDEFGVFSTIEGIVHEINDYGGVVKFEQYNDVYGFVSRYQMAGNLLEENAVIRATVLDVSKIERLVDLSLKPEFMNRSNEENSTIQTLKKKRKWEPKGLEVNQIVNALVEIVKENYLVLSLPEYSFMIGNASLTDYNTQKLPPKQYTHGQSVIATVMALPAPATGGRLLLLLKAVSNGVETSSSKRAKKKSSYDIGLLIQAEIAEIRPIELRVKFGPGFHGRIHITEATDGNSAESPFASYRIGQTLTARIVSKGGKPENVKGGYGWELSVKPSLLKESGDMDGRLMAEEFNYSYGQHVCGYVYKVDPECVWLTLSRDVKAQLYILDSSCEPSELAEFQERFYVGKALSGYVISMNKEKKLLRLVLRTPPDGCILLKENDSNSRSLRHLLNGGVVGGRILKILPGIGGLLLQVDQHHYGKVHYTELTDSWVPDPLSGYHEGQFVKCRVLEINHASNGTVHVDLSLRSPPDASLGINVHSSSQRVDKIADLHPNMVVQGYVKNVTSKGCFIMLSRNIDAKVLLSNLSEYFVEDPENEFPVGKLVVGRVLSVEPLSKRVEVSLKTSSAVGASKSDSNPLNQITLGDAIAGRIKRVESFGLFISINNTNVVGLCHISELSDDCMDDIMAKFKAGDGVTAKVLKVDKDRNRVSLGMKKSYFKDEAVLQASSKQNHDPANGTDDSVALSKPKVLARSSSTFIENRNDEPENHHTILADVASRALVPALEVQLEDIENIGSVDDEGDVGEGILNVGGDTAEEKHQKRAKKKDREEKEQEIRAAEERLLEKDIPPRSEEEFEKLIHSSPNCSYLWIKYMAFMLSLANVDKARSIAERALRTINIREESEKLNIWGAYFNLENKYGNPPEEAVTKVFQRALQYCDAKKVHLALVEMYEMTEQYKFADELLDKMCRKFKHSCKVWFRKIQSLLKRNSDGVQSVLSRALLGLPRHKHIKFIKQTAILEFKCGVADRGRSIFEGMLREYPKRTDLWSIYLDQEIRLGDVDTIRGLFERAISVSLPAKKMKSIFKKYLEYEKCVGDEERIEAVKKAAMDYVATHG